MNKFPKTSTKFLAAQRGQSNVSIEKEEKSENAIAYIKQSFEELFKIINNPTYHKSNLIRILGSLKSPLKAALKYKLFPLFTNNFFQQLILYCLNENRVDEGKALCDLLKKICIIFSNHQYPFSQESLNKIIEFVTVIDPCSKTSLTLLMLISKKYPDLCIQFEQFFYQNFHIETVEIISLFIYHVINTAIMIPDFDFLPMVEVIGKILSGCPNINAQTTVYTTIKITLTQKVPLFIENFQSEFWLKHFCEMRRSQLNCITILGWELTGLMIEFINQQIITSKEYFDLPLINHFLCKDGESSHKVQIAIFNFLGNAIKRCPLIIDIILENENPEFSILVPLMNCIHYSIYQVQYSALSVLLDILMRANAFQLRMIGPVNVVDALFNHILTVDNTTELTVIRCLIRVVNACNTSKLDYKIEEIFDMFEAYDALMSLFDSEVVANEVQTLLDLVYKNKFAYFLYYFVCEIFNL